MTTIQDIIGDYTPLSNAVVKELKLVKGAIACKIFYTSNLKDRVCRMGLTRFADEIGLAASAVSRNIETLINEGYIERVKDHTPTEPAHYRCTDKFYSIAKGIALSNRGIALSNRGIALSNQEEEVKEEIKEKTVVAAAFSIYENEIGMLTQMSRDLIIDYCAEYSEAWFIQALTIAVAGNKRNLRYIGGILKRWKAQGGPQHDKPNGANNGSFKTNSSGRTGIDLDAKPYIDIYTSEYVWPDGHRTPAE